VRIGWLADKPKGFKGGAELSSDELVGAAAYFDVEVVECTPNDIAADVDAYVIMNCTEYDAGHIAALKGRPVINSVRDMWAYGDDELRDWLLSNAAMTIFNSELHYRWFLRPVNTPVAIVPPPMDLAPFRAASEAYEGEREGVLWIGAMHRVKGIMEAVYWARTNKTQVDFYGTGTSIPKQEQFVRYCGLTAYNRVPELMARYKTLLYIVRGVEGFGRTIAEAWASGMELELGGMIGAKWWIDNYPASLDNGAEIFWQTVLHHPELPWS